VAVVDFFIEREPQNRRCLAAQTGAGRYRKNRDPDMKRNNAAPGAGSSLAADVVLVLADGPKRFARLPAATHGWQSTMSAAIAGLIEDHFVERSGTAAFGLTPTIQWATTTPPVSTVPLSTTIADVLPDITIGVIPPRMLRPKGLARPDHLKSRSRPR
jgi:hypothetical protein